MSLFRRKKSVTVEEEETQVDELEALHAEADRAEEQARAEAAKAQRLRQRQGPHDVTEVDEDGDWLDLGALRLPAITAELGLEVDRETQTVRSVTANLGDSAVTIAVFAAPRTEGIWTGVRDHLAAEITRSGGTADIQNGTFGSEILARIPVRTPDGRTGHQATRFIGIDGPRWFMRAVVNGAAAHDKNRAVDVEDVIKGLSLIHI